MRREQTRVMRFGLGTAAVLLVFGLGGLVASQSGAAPKRAGTVTVTFGDKGSTVYLHTGETLRVVLDSTYWSMHPSSNADVLPARGAVTVVPRLRGCVPGQGCGTVTATFRASAPGSATLSASRVSCGEALRCTMGNGSFYVTVRVR